MPRMEPMTLATFVRSGDEDQPLSARRRRRQPSVPLMLKQPVKPAVPRKTIRAFGRQVRRQSPDHTPGTVNVMLNRRLKPPPVPSMRRRASDGPRVDGVRRCSRKFCCFRAATLLAEFYRVPAGARRSWRHRQTAVPRSGPAPGAKDTGSAAAPVGRLPSVEHNDPGRADDLEPNRRPRASEHPAKPNRKPVGTSRRIFIFSLPSRSPVFA